MAVVKSGDRPIWEAAALRGNPFHVIRAASADKGEQPRGLSFPIAQIRGSRSSAAVRVERDMVFS